MSKKDIQFLRKLADYLETSSWGHDRDAYRCKKCGYAKRLRELVAKVAK